MDLEAEYFAEDDVPTARFLDCAFARFLALTWELVV